MNRRPAQPKPPRRDPAAGEQDGTAEQVSQLLHHLDEVRQTRHGEPIHLLNDLERIRRQRQRASVRLLQELTPHLDAARTVERELDRHLARRFNVFRYLRDDELGLSQIIAELLDPGAEHGQGTTFLEAMLELLGVSLDGTVESSRSDLAKAGGRGTAAEWKRHFGARSNAREKIRVAREREVRVTTERRTPRGRFVDITVDIPTADGKLFCLAFENKPYAEDQHRQCRDYLRFLARHYDRFLLVYLPPRYRLPNESSLPKTARHRWKDHFRVLPWVADDPVEVDDNAAKQERADSMQAGSDGDDANSGDDDASNGDGAAAGQDASDGKDRNDGSGLGGSDGNRGPAHDVGHHATAAQDNGAPGDDESGEDGAAHDHAFVGEGTSLADWFGTCCKLSDAERIRWFLREAQLYCQRHFGESRMTDTEARYICEYLDENPKHLHAAFAVARAWPSALEDVHRRFLEHLRDRTAEKLAEVVPTNRHDLVVRCHYEGANQSIKNVLWISRIGWTEYVDAPERVRCGGRTTILFQSQGKGMNNWYWGVRSPKPRGQMTTDEAKRRVKIESALRRHGLALARHSDWWPHWEHPRYRNWNEIIPELGQEAAKGRGKITDYYVNGLLKIARKAIPAIDEVELSPSANASAQPADDTASTIPANPAAPASGDSSSRD